MSNAARYRLHTEDPHCRLCGRETKIDVDSEDPAFAVCKKLPDQIPKKGEPALRILICRQCCKDRFEQAPIPARPVAHAQGVNILTKMCLKQQPFATSRDAMASGIGKVFECPFCLLWHRTLTFRTYREIQEQLRIGRAFIAANPSHQIVLRLERKMTRAPKPKEQKA